MRWEAALDGAEFRQFWTEPRVCVLSTVRADGRPHAVLVRATLDLRAATARVLSGGGSRKVVNVRAAGPAGAPVSLSQLDGLRWSSLEGVAVVRAEPDAVRDAERRHAQRYPAPRPNPERVVIEISVHTVLGRL